jgi:hypothetical protein
MRCSVTQVRHVSPSEEARSREPVTPPEKGGEVSVTARCPDGLVILQTELKEGVPVGTPFASASTFSHRRTE